MYGGPFTSHQTTAINANEMTGGHRALWTRDPGLPSGHPAGVRVQYHSLRDPETVDQRRLNAGPASATLSRH